MYLSFSQSELSEEDKDTVKSHIDRDSADDKLKDLLDWIYAIRHNVRHLVGVIIINIVSNVLSATSVYFHKANVKSKWYLRWILWGS